MANAGETKRQVRDLNGEISQRNANIRVDALRKTYGEDFAQGVRGDTKLDVLLKTTDTRSLTEYLKKR
jgi:hypothetical protein